MSNRLGLSSPKTSATTVSKWDISKDMSRIDDSTTIVLSLDAESAISGWPGKTNRPSLILRCKQKQTEAYIVTGMPPQVEYGSDGATVTTRLDKDRAIKLRMSKSTDGEALFFGQSVGFIKSMLRKSTLLFDFTPFNSSPVMTTFDLRGIDEAIKPLRETCKW